MWREPEVYWASLALLVGLLSLAYLKLRRLVITELEAQIGPRAAALSEIAERVWKENQAIERTLSRCEETIAARGTTKQTGMVLVLGSIQLADGPPQQFCAGRLFRLNEGERGEFAETMYMPLVPGTIVIALGNLVLDGVLANQRSFVPWTEQHGGVPVAVVPETVGVGGQLRVGVRGHAW